MTTLVRTSDVPAKERTDLWRAAASEAYVPLDMRLDDADAFSGRILGQVFGELRIGEVIADAHQAHRTGKLIGRHEQQPHYKLSMPVRGYCLVQQDGREASLTPGDLAIYDTSRPYTVIFQDTCQMLTLMFPRRNLHLPADRLADITASRVSGRHSVGALLSPLLFNLVSRMDEIDGAQSLRLADNVVDMVATLFAGELGEDPAKIAVGQRCLTLRVKAFIEAHLDDTDLTPGTIAAAMHISTGYLHKLFRREHTTVSRWIRERRLEHCRRDLRDPGQAELAVSSVAAHWGFIDAAHFSRLFKAAYGLPPREYRIISEGDANIRLDATS
ncbi:helix-turn-helix domain-containing protein [Amycolatopsis nigrescens]|uniref:AraC-like ligand-binding domain-containing protein n=1 Tax=Amycolatopsis nigrescens TaxID=381445 RepID=UPI00037F523B|nr:helix-turn-helix domain-containing protein [Amycolatopsis nigrescens]